MFARKEKAKIFLERKEKDERKEKTNFLFI